MMRTNEVEYLDLPLTNSGRLDLAALDGDEAHPDVQARGDHIRIDFKADKQMKRVGKGSPRVANLEELKISFVTNLKEQIPEILKCKVEAYFKGRGHIILWTPHYCPELQPIEMFWASGKHHVSLNYQNDVTMKKFIQFLCEG